MGSNSKVTRFRKRRGINIGFFVFLIIFIYVSISVYMFFTKKHLSIYEVKEGSTSDDTVFTGLIHRDEEVFYTDAAGYINYYHKDQDRIARNTTIYSIDESKDTYDLINSNDSKISYSSSDLKELEKEISDFHNDYQEMDYLEVYNIRNDIENTMLDINNNYMLSNLQKVLKSNGTSDVFRVVNSKSSGIITYYTDNLENVTKDNITTKDFKTDSYKKTQLRTTNLLETGSPVYKLVKSDDWSILVPLNKSQYNKLSEKDSISITFTEDGLTANATVAVFKKDGNYFAQLGLNKYMIDYINERFVTIDLSLNSAVGLKIPVSSIVTKELYPIPEDYFTVGGDSGSNGIVRESYGKNGDVNYVFVPADVYYNDGTYSYVDSRLFDTGTWIYSEKLKKRYQVNKKKSFKGVFNVNKGYATFRRIEVLYENEEYCIVKKDTQYGLSVYDHIALDGTTAVEQAIIY